MYQQDSLVSGYRPASKFAPGADPRFAADRISTLGYIGLILLLLVPVFNAIPFGIWAFGTKAGPNKRAFSRAALILQIPYLAFAVIYIFTLFTGLGGL